MEAKKGVFSYKETLVTMATGAHGSSSGTEEAMFAESGKPAAKLGKSGSSDMIKGKDGEVGRRACGLGESGIVPVQRQRLRERLQKHMASRMEYRINHPLHSQIHLGLN